jgi:hypothetical protein
MYWRACGACVVNTIEICNGKPPTDLYNINRGRLKYGKT